MTTKKSFERYLNNMGFLFIETLFLPWRCLRPIAGIFYTLQIAIGI